MLRSTRFAPSRGPRARWLRALPALALAACASIPFLGRGRAETWGFTAPWDPRSAASVAAHGAALDVVVSGWIALDSATGRPLVLFTDSLALPPGARRFALVTSWLGDRFHPALVRRLAADTAALAATARGVASLAAGNVAAGAPRYEGLVLDLEGLAPEDAPALIRVVDALARAAHESGVAMVAVAVPALDTAAYPLQPLLAVADRAVVMLYDEHWAGSDPGPVASPAWVRRALAVRVSEAGASRLVAALPLYGYQWRPDRPTEVIGWADAQRLAGSASTPLARDPATATLRALRVRDLGDPWELWTSDAVLLDTLARHARATGVHTIALWRLGLEDPAVWQRLAR